MQVALTHEQYIAALVSGTLLGQQCASCGAKNAPPTMVCRQCGCLELRTVELEKRGKIATLTTIHTAPEGFEAPYVVCLVDLDEGPRLMGRLRNVDPLRADLGLIGRAVTVDHHVHAGDRFSAGRLVGFAFELA